MSITIEAGPGVQISDGMVVGPSVGVSLSGNDYATYLLRDDFTTAEAAPLASPRTAEPGPGTLTLVQNDGQFSISGGKLAFPAQTTPAAGDQGFIGAGLSRVAGRALISKINASTMADMFNSVWASANSIVFGGFGNMAGGFYMETASLYVVEFAVGFIVAGGLSAATEYSVCTVQRASGHFALIKGGIYTNWTLLYVGATSNTATVYPAFSNSKAVGTLDTFRVLDLPAPFDDDYGLATDRLSGAVSAGATFTHEADCVIEWTQTTLPSAAGTVVHFRRQDADNNWYIQIQGTDFYLAERVAGSPVTRAQALGVMSNGHRIVIVCDGTTIRGYSNNVLRWTYSSATNFAAETNARLDALGTSAVVSDFVTWPRQLTGAAATILDQSVA